MAVLTYEELVSELNTKIKENGNKEITGPLLNSYLQDILDTVTIKHIVLDTVARNAITTKYAGMRVYVTSEETTYILKTDLSTWVDVATDAYKKSEVDGFINSKVDKISGKGLSTNDFTNPYKAKIDSVEADATKNETDAYLVNRVNHTGEQGTDTITGLDDLIDGILGDVVNLEAGVNVSYKNIVITTDSVYQISGREHTVVSVDNDGSGRTVVLPDASINNGRIVAIKKGDVKATTLTIQPFDYQESNSTSSDFQLIEGDINLSTARAGDTVWLQAKSGRWYTISGILLGDNEKIIKKESQFTEVGGKYVLETGVNYKIGVANLSITKPFDLSNITTITSMQLGLNTLSYSGAGVMFQGTFTGTFSIDSGLIVGDGLNNVWDVVGNGISTSNILVADKITFLNFNGIGKIDNIGGVNYRSIQHANCGVGFVFKDIPLLQLDNVPINNAVTSNSPRVVLDGTFISVRLGGLALTVQSGESFLQISKNITLTGSFIISNNQFSTGLGGEFLATAKTGTTTAFADNGSGGTTVTSASHGLTIEQVVEITGSGVGAYDTIHQDIFNVTSNTFDIPVAFVSNPATGTFDTGDSNDFLDKNTFQFKDNGTQIDTNELAKYNSVNSISVTITAVNTPVGVIGVVGDWASVIVRRFELQAAGDPAGSVQYTGDKFLTFKVSARIAADVVGGTAVKMTGYITVNGVTQTDSAFSIEQAREATLNPEDIFNLSTGDYIGVAVENNDSTANIDVSFVNINITKA